MTRYGHIKLSRKLFDGDPWWAEERAYSRFEAWVDMLRLAAWRDASTTYRGEMIPISRGEFVLSVRSASVRWGWSTKMVRTFIKQAQRMDRIRAQRETRAGEVYLIVNYDTYQQGGTVEDTPEGTEKGTAKGKARAQQGHSEGTAGAQEEAVKQGNRESKHSRRAKQPPDEPKDNWVSSLYEWWTAHIGAITPGQLGKLAKPIHDTHGAEAIQNAAKVYFSPEEGPRYKTPADFFATFAHWHQTAQEPLVRNGDLTERGRKIWEHK